MNSAWYYFCRSENPLISKTATHVTLMWSPPFLWPGQRIQDWNITVTNKNDGNTSHHILNSSFTDPIISFSMSWSCLQLSTMTCTEIIFSISPVSEAAPKVMQTVNISDWIWNSGIANYYNQCMDVSKHLIINYTSIYYNNYFSNTVSNTTVTMSRDNRIGCQC